MHIYESSHVLITYVYFNLYTYVKHSVESRISIVQIVIPTCTSRHFNSYEK